MNEQLYLADEECASGESYDEFLIWTERMEQELYNAEHAFCW